MKREFLTGLGVAEDVIDKISMDGLADYSRSSGYVNGNVTFTNETVQFNYDRGRAFTVDAMDNEETAGLAFGKLSSEFIRTKVVPEMDAVRFATYAGVSGIGTASGALSNGLDVLAAITVANNAMDEAEVSADGRYLFITPTLHNLINAVDSYKSKAMLDKFAGVVDVPQSRFFTAVDLYDGKSSGETVGGFVKDPSSGKNINFMIIQKSAVIQFTKHTVNKVIISTGSEISTPFAASERTCSLLNSPFESNSLS